MMNSNNNGIVFNGGQGPLMTGTWVNPQNGDSFTVRDCYFEDNQLMVQTTDGRYLSYNQVQNYVQGNKPADNEAVVKNAPNHGNDELPPEVANLISTDDDPGILPEDLNLISGNTRQTPVSLGNINKTVSTEPVEPSNLMIIKKALSKCSVPSFDINIKWNGEFPYKEIDLLRNIMDINLEEIISYYINNIDVELVAHSIGTAIAEEIEDHLKRASTPVVKESKKENPIVEEPKKTTPKKATPKKTTTKKTE